MPVSSLVRLNTTTPRGRNRATWWSSRLYEAEGALIHGMLYASHASPVATSPPTHALIKPATAVLATHPTRIMIVVKNGCASRMHLRPNPADIPPSTFRIIHSLSTWSSSSRLNTPDRYVEFAFQCLWSVGVADGRQMDNRKRRNSLVSEE
jgi:hypothetical protein